jgi:hypothetical protein
MKDKKNNQRQKVATQRETQQHKGTNTQIISCNSSAKGSSSMKGHNNKAKTK